MNNLSHPELMSLWCFHCRHYFVLCPDSIVVSMVGEDDQDFLIRQIKILYVNRIVRAVRRSLHSPRSLHFSVALHAMEIVFNQLSCKRSFRLGSLEAKPSTPGCIIPSHALDYRICNVSDAPTWWAISDQLSELLREGSGLSSRSIY